MSRPVRRAQERTAVGEVMDRPRLRASGILSRKGSGDHQVSLIARHVVPRNEQDRRPPLEPDVLGTLLTLQWTCMIGSVQSRRLESLHPNCRSDLRFPDRRRIRRSRGIPVSHGRMTLRQDPRRHALVVQAIIDSRSRRFSNICAITGPSICTVTTRNFTTIVSRAHAPSIIASRQGTGQHSDSR